MLIKSIIFDKLTYFQFVNFPMQKFHNYLFSLKYQKLLSNFDKQNDIYSKMNINY